MSSPFDEYNWSVLYYGDEFLAHGVSFHEALRCVLEGLSEPFVDQGIVRYLPLFSISSEPRHFTEGQSEMVGGYYFSYGLGDQLIEEEGIVCDIRELIEVNPALNINHAADSIYNIFANIDLCSGAFCDIPILHEWPEDRINYLEEFDPLLRQILIEAYQEELDSGQTIHAVFDKTKLMDLKDLHMWSFQQIFYFYACKLGEYEGLEGKYGFGDSEFRDHIVLSWGCAPHAHEMAFGIAYNIPGEQEVEDPLSLVPEFVYSEKFLQQVHSLIE